MINIINNYELKKKKKVFIFWCKSDNMHAFTDISRFVWSDVV